MKMLFFVLLVALLFSSCATYYATSVEEAFPQHNNDPRTGLLVIDGTAAFNMYIYDRAGRLVWESYIEGQDPTFDVVINGQRKLRYLVVTMESPGNYRVEILPFYFVDKLFAPRFRHDLPKQSYSFSIDKDPQDYYLMGNYWGWALHINPGKIPREATSLPFWNINFQGNFGGRK